MAVNCIYTGLAETVLLFLHFKDTYTAVLYISLKITNCKYRLK